MAWPPQTVKTQGIPPGHSHGGTGFGSAHNPFFASRACFSNPSSTVSAGAYFRYHQHQPSLTSSWLTLVPSGRSTSGGTLYLAPA